jgi:hypothetical protein
LPLEAEARVTSDEAPNVSIPTLPKETKGRPDQAAIDLRALTDYV